MQRGGRLDERSKSTPDLGETAAPESRPLDYAPLRPRKSLLAANQSLGGIFATVPALGLMVLTWWLLAMSYYGYGGAIGGICCLYIPCTVTTLLLGLLGLTEQGPHGAKCDGTLAGWSLLIAVGCWGLVGFLFLLRVVIDVLR
jgi:hypothetical protein